MEENIVSRDVVREICVVSLVLWKEPIRFLSVSMPLSMLVLAYPTNFWGLGLEISSIGDGGFWFDYGYAPCQ